MSVSAASYAMRGEGHCAAGTRERVLRAAARVAYTPNLYAAGLRALRSRANAAGVPVAVLVRKTPGPGFYPTVEMREGIRAGVAERGFILQEHTIDEGEDIRPLLRMLWHRGVRGLIFSSRSTLERDLSADWSRFCVVTCNRWDSHSVFHSVREDSFGQVRTLWTEVAARGYRRIGFALCRHAGDLLDDLEREAALVLHQQRGARAGHAVVPPYLGAHDDGEAFLRWFRRCKPDCVVGFSAFQHHVLTDSGVRVPEDVAYASIHPGLVAGGLAGLEDATRPVGRMAARLMDSLVRHREAGRPALPETLLVRTELVPGPSLPAVAARVPHPPRPGRRERFSPGRGPAG